MPDLYASPWRVTLAGVLVLDWTDRLTGDPQITQSTQIQGIAPIRATYAGRAIRLLREHVISFERHRTSTHPVQAEKYRVDHLRALAAITAPGDCVIEFLAGGSTTLKEAVLLPLSATCENDVFVAPYQIVGGELLATSGVPAPGAEPSLFGELIAPEIIPP